MALGLNWDVDGEGRSLSAGRIETLKLRGGGREGAGRIEAGGRATRTRALGSQLVFKIQRNPAELYKQRKAIDDN